MKNFIDRAKLFFSKDKEFRAALYNIMGFYPHNVDLYRIAFAHKSLEYKSKKSGNKPFNNERLEFLGDAVLETVVSDIVYRHFPNKREGFLTNTRSKIVSRESLGRLAKDLGIDRLIQSQAHSRAHNSYLAGNSFEALMGAIYLDRGFHYAFRFIEKRIIGAALDLEGVAHKEVNFKSKLLEWSQKNRIRIEFKENHTGNHNGNTPNFLTEIIIEGLLAGEGKGFSKKESHQNASKDALTQMRRDPQLIDSVFRSKEKRTAMEADEFFVLPKIDEIESELNRSRHEKAERTKRERKDRNNKKASGKGEKEKMEKSSEASSEAKGENKANKANKAENGNERQNAKTRHGKTEKSSATANKEQRAPKHPSERPKQTTESTTAANVNESDKARPIAEQPAEIGLETVSLPEPAPPVVSHSDAPSEPAPSSETSAKPVENDNLIIVDDIAPATASMEEQLPIAAPTVAETRLATTPQPTEEIAATASPERTEETPATIPVGTDESEEKERETSPVETTDYLECVTQLDDTKSESVNEKAKKRRRRSGKRQSAKEFTNTTPPPAEQSRRSEKAALKAQEETRRQTIERAKTDLMPEVGETSEAIETDSTNATPNDTATPRNNGRRQRRSNNRRIDDSTEATPNNDGGNKEEEPKEKPTRRRSNNRRSTPTEENEPSAAERRQREDLIAAAEAAAYDDI